MSEFVWKTADGTKLTLSEMTNDHLKNAARYLRQRAENEIQAYWGAGSMFQGEMAQDAWMSQEGDEQDKYNSRITVAELMEMELERRTRSDHRS